jgi:CCR4-NOT transcription complex subunit 1
VSLFPCLFFLWSLHLFLQTTYNLFQREVSLIVFPMIVKSDVGSGMILHLWHINPNLVLRGFMDSQNRDVDSIIRIADICQELKVVLI